MTRPHCLDFFCGAGGASVGYDRAGFDVYGSDLFPMPNYPYPFVQDDAIALFADLLRGYPVRFSNGERLLLSDFDFIAGSPPCQAFSTKTRDKSKHLNLIDPFRDLLEQWGGVYVIENVPTAPLRDPVRLCGSSFGLDVQRHRHFESNLDLVGLPCKHDWWRQRFKVYDHGHWYLSKTVPVFGSGGGKAREHWQCAMGIDWMTDDELAEAIPPAYTTWIGWQVIAEVKARSTWQEAL